MAKQVPLCTTVIKEPSSGWEPPVEAPRRSDGGSNMPSNLLPETVTAPSQPVSGYEVRARWRATHCSHKAPHNGRGIRLHRRINANTSGVEEMGHEVNRPHIGVGGRRPREG